MFTWSLSGKHEWYLYSVIEMERELERKSDTDPKAFGDVVKKSSRQEYTGRPE